ncbi:MAG: acetyl-CoA carboxylase biotin carboxyl carrier protein [Acidobacteriales bacterium]|nr:acetyl-CoA carboxylase biotin carboxyl carrier protein [Terriglobales bacterium]
MTLDEIRELISLVRETGVAELELQRGSDRVKIRLHAEPTKPEFVLPYPTFGASQPVAAQAAPAAVPATMPNGAKAEVVDEALSDPTLVYVKAPIVGTFYESPSPGAAPFVQEGDRVKPGQVLCIIESMKLMNEIEAEVAGVIVKRFVQNSNPVEYGETLYAVKPS